MGGKLVPAPEKQVEGPFTAVSFQGGRRPWWTPHPSLLQSFKLLLLNLHGGHFHPLEIPSCILGIN